MPFETVTGNLLDSGDYAGGLQKLSAKAGYQDLLSLQRRLASHLKTSTWSWGIRA